MKNLFSKMWKGIKKFFATIFRFIQKRKIVSIIILLILVGGGYWAYTTYAAGQTATQYSIARVTTGPLQVTVSDSGQVSSQDDLDVTPQGSASGEITKIYVTPGETVTAGAVIAQLDTTDAAEAVTSAQQNLQAAQISYQQTLASSNTGISTDETSVQSNQTAAVNAVIKAYTDLPAVMQGTDSILHNLSDVTGFTAEEYIDAYAGYIPTAQAKSYRAQVETDYAIATADYQKTQAEYAATNTANLTDAQTQQLATDSEQTTAAINVELKDILTYYDYISAQVQSGELIMPAQLASQITTLNGYQTTVSADDTSLTNTSNTLQTSIATLAQDTESLDSTNVPLNVQNAQLNVAKAQEALTEAETTEDDYTVRAPFAGTIATVPVNQYDQASSGTTIATLVTNQEYADLTVNEADVAKLSLGQPATLTFDALPKVTVQGTVEQIDPVGTVTQGVVTYDVRIGFNEQNSSVKPGMTVDATIITSSVSNAIQVPSGAIHTVGTSSYVEVATLTNASSTLASMGSSTAAHRRMRTASSTASYGGAAAGVYGGTGGFAGASSTMGTSSATGFGGGMMSSTTAGASATAAAAFTRAITVPASEATIKDVPVVLGITNDTDTQIVSGLKPGEFVVTATVTASSATKKTTAASATSLLGGTSSRALTGGGGYGGGTGGGTYRAAGGGGAGGG